jgi:phosphatidylglycerophosphatase A
MIDSTAVLTVITGALTGAATLAGLWAVRKEIHRRRQADPGALVVDEIAGMWMTYLVACPALDSASPTALGLVVASGFLLFRAFDVVKPWPINALEHLEGALGVMADDLAAGLVAGCGVLGIVWLS